MRVLPCKCGCNSGPDGRRGIAFAHSQSRKQKKNRISKVKQATKSPCKATGAFWAFSEKCGAWDKRPWLWDFAHEKRLNNGKNTHVRGINAHGRVDCGPAETVDECRDAGTAFFFWWVPGGTGRGSRHGPPASTVDDCGDAGTAIVFLERPGGTGRGSRHAPRQARLTSAGTRGRRMFFLNVPAERGSRGSPPGQSLDLESSSGVREKEGTNSRMNSWTSGRGF